jgi:hypothetical protein
MWLKIVYDEEDIAKWPINPDKIIVSLSNEKTVPINDDLRSFRVSPIFPLIPDYKINSIEDSVIFFFNFSNAFRVLGRIEKMGSDELKNSVFFSTGLSSIILINGDEKIWKEFKDIAKYKEVASEKWILKKNTIEKIEYSPQEVNEKIEKQEIIDYDVLPITERAIIDEFKINIKLLLLKLTSHMPSELPKFKKLIEEINSLIIELVFLVELKGNPPTTLSEFTTEDLKNIKINHVIRHQNIDRIIQVNSALSYISTQAFSGAIPILERRSLIRRNSLLGVGSAILALNNIARFIENSFSKVHFDEVINKLMSVSTSLKGLEDLPQYVSKDWDKGSINTFENLTSEDTPEFKLPYFSGRLGFRETEYCIAAAIQSITSGASLEWSLMTLTHEMLHGHVRNIITEIFYGNDTMQAEHQRDHFYDSFKKKLNKKEVEEKLLDSIRNIILCYCCYTATHGSITTKLPYTSNNFDIKLPGKDELWNIFERENRNISEIFVHILDLHYFYASRVSVYIPLIWCSWVAVPHINGDIRQYILRSLLTVSSKIEGSAIVRFNKAVSMVKDLLKENSSNKLNYPIVDDVIAILDDEKKLNEYYFAAFKGSLIIVDMVKNIFISSKIRGHLITDDLVKWESNEKDENSFEEKYSYELPDGFHDELIKSPISYLLDKMIKELHSNDQRVDIERETALQFLALNSNE